MVSISHFKTRISVISLKLLAPTQNTGRKDHIVGGFTTDEKYRLKTGFFDRLKRKGESKNAEDKDSVVSMRDLAGPLVSLGIAKNQREMEDILKRVDCV